MGVPEARQAVASEVGIAAFGEIKHGGEKVADADQVRDARAFGNAGARDDERHVQRRAIEVVAVAVKTLLAELFAVVGGDDDNRVPAFGRILEKIEQAPDLRVQKGQAIVVGGDQSGAVAGREVRGRARAIQVIEQLVDQPI